LAPENCNQKVWTSVKLLALQDKTVQSLSGGTCESMPWLVARMPLNERILLNE
jgi:hypothetical protein